MTYVVQLPWNNSDLQNIYEAILGISIDTTGLATEETLLQVRELVQDGNDLLDTINTNLVDELDTANANLVEIFDVLDSQLDINLTALATLIKGSNLPYGNGCTLKDIYDVTYQGVQQIGRINNRAQTAYIDTSFIGNYPNATAANAGANGWINTAATSLVGTGIQFVCRPDDSTYDVFAISATGF